MRPHLLELEAFGAFPGRVTLDLDALGGGGLMLLCGRTGSGKTTLLDAIGFALYGTVPGARSKAKDLRSHHAADGVAPWVQLEFTARGRRFRVRRSPAWQRARRASDVPASGQLLEEVDGAWVPRSTRLDEIGHELAMVLGMNAEQFHQVVVLPQGRFADFLQASSEKRRELLRQLFAVERFEQVQEWLRDRAQRAEAQLRDAAAEAERLAARVAQADGSDVPDDLAVEVWAAGLLTSALREADLLGRQLDLADRRRSETETALLETRELAGRQRRRVAAEAELVTARAAEARVALLRERLDAGRRAQPVGLAAETSSAAERALRSAEAEASAHDADLAAAEMRWVTPLAERGAGELVAAAAAAQSRVGELTALADLDTSVAAADRERALADRLATEAAARVLVLTRTVEVTGPAEVASCQRRLSELRARLATLPTLRREAEDLDAAVRTRADLHDAEALVEAAARRLADATTETDTARTQERAIRNRRIDAAATELAAYLEDDTPCPVCGSLEHPEIAELRDSDATREQEAAAGERVASTTALLARRTGEHAAARERVAVLRTAARAAAPERPGLTTELASLERLLPAEPVAEGELERAQGHLAGAREALVGSRHESESQRATAAAALHRATAGRERLALTIGDASFAAAVATAQRDARLLARAADLAAVVAERRRAHERAGADLAALGQVQGFADVDAALAACCDPPELERLQTAVTGHDRALAGLTARLADPDLAVAVVPPADVEAAELASQTARKAADQLRSDAALARQRADALAGLIPALTAATARQEPLRASAAQLRELAEVANGRAPNRLLMPLASFVLAARLEDVAEAASARLLTMSGGRYTLVHNEVGGDRRSRAGLDLAVDDAWTGRRRDTATLSGGETFMAALALALGLTDVVTAETGGASIDALFVDEGFGSLDPDSLDAVMDVLDSLRSGGRLVGVVSHVAEMRQRIPTQVLVDKGTAGSTLRTVPGG